MASIDALEKELRDFWSDIIINNVEISQDIILQMLELLDVSKASGPDVIPGQLLKEGAFWNSKPLHELFVLSLNQGNLPNDWIPSLVPSPAEACQHPQKSSATCCQMGLWYKMGPH